MPLHTIYETKSNLVTALRLSSDGRTLSWNSVPDATAFIICTSNACSPPNTRIFLNEVQHLNPEGDFNNVVLQVKENGHSYDLQYTRERSFSFAHKAVQSPVRYQVWAVVGGTAHICPPILHENATIVKGSIGLALERSNTFKGYTQCTLTRQATIPNPDVENDWLVGYRVVTCRDAIFPIPRSMENQAFFIPAPQEKLTFFVRDCYDEYIKLIL